VTEEGPADSPGGRRADSPAERLPTGHPDEEPRPPRRVVHGPVAVEAVDRHGGADAAGPEALDLNRWGLLAASVAHSEGVRRPAELGLAFVGESEIAALASVWLHSDHPTDVLAFPVEASARRSLRRAPVGDPPLLIGDVVVCPQVAARQADEAGHAPADELALLIVHGVLHLLGHDHAGPVESLKMKRRTRTLLARFHRPGRERTAAPAAGSRRVG